MHIPQLTNGYFDKHTMLFYDYRQYIHTNNFHCYPMLHAFQKAISKTLEVLNAAQEGMGQNPFSALMGSGT
jgi:hypothetical protein